MVGRVVWSDVPGSYNPDGDEHQLRQRRDSNRKRFATRLPVSNGMLAGGTY